MKVILLEDVKPHGKKEDLVEVSDSYARNFLIPKKLAIEATSSNVNSRKQKLINEEKQKAEEKEKASILYAAINNKSVDVKVRCGEGKLYGSVTTQDIANALSGKGFVVDKRNIKLKDNIRELGRFEVDVKCYVGSVAKVFVNIISGENK